MSFASVDKIVLTGPSWVTGINTCRCTYVQYQPSAQTCQLSLALCLRLRLKPSGAALILIGPLCALGHMQSSSDMEPKSEMTHPPNNPLALSPVVQIRVPRLMRWPLLHYNGRGRVVGFSEEQSAVCL
ncbi:hypothetical protein QQF64_028394 [Cirrhinus molitorella]|uniref:Uncharacterized protein n=1 Tax=Cirrhinus molitorella TaxID=172907 RepID=A0ABR3N6W2_9TELE